MEFHLRLFIFIPSCFLLDITEIVGGFVPLLTQGLLSFLKLGMMLIAVAFSYSAPLLTSKACEKLQAANLISFRTEKKSQTIGRETADKNNNNEKTAYYLNPILLSVLFSYSELRLNLKGCWDGKLRKTLSGRFKVFRIRTI